MNVSVAPSSVGLSRALPITVAVLAMGGQGGGVLVDWIVALAEQRGWFAQSTSMPGVAQRTGATIYYIEMIAPDPGKPGRHPVLSLMPAPGGMVTSVTPLNMSAWSDPGSMAESLLRRAMCAAPIFRGVAPKALER